MAAPTNERPIIVAFTLDFETGGLDCQKHAITQIALHAVRIDTGEILDRYVQYVLPYAKQESKGKPKRKVLKSKLDQSETEMMEYTEKALTYSAITMDMINQLGVPLERVCADVIDFIKRNTLTTKANLKPFFIGQNIGFDLSMLQQIMEFTGNMKEFVKLVRGVYDFYGNFQPLYLDTIILGQMALCHEADMTSYKLELLAERMGVELDDAHDADADVTATTNIAMECARRMRVSINSDTSGMVVAKKEKSRTHFKI